MPLSELGSFDGKFTIAEDLTKWMNNFETAVIGGPEVRDLMHTRGILNDGDTLGYAFGLSLGTYRGLQTVGHGGADAGFRSNVMRFPEYGYSIAVLSNLGSFNAGQMAQRVADVYLEEYLEPVEREAEPEDTSTAEAVSVDPAIFEDYVGDYELEVGINFIIEFNECLFSFVIKAIYTHLDCFRFVLED